MQDSHTGKIKLITEDTYGNIMAGSQNAVHVGDVFKVNRCYFEIENISGGGIKAKGITRGEYFNKRRK